MVRIGRTQLASLRNASTATIHQAASEIVEQVSRESNVFEPEAASKIPRFDLDGKCVSYCLSFRTVVVSPDRLDSADSDTIEIFDSIHSVRSLTSSSSSTYVLCL